VLGVIDATDHEELQQALSQLGGSITQRLADTRNDLISLLGDLEAGLDFVEEDIEFVLPEDVIHRVSEAAAKIADLLQTTDERMSTGVSRSVVLAGLPNAGKSTLFNAILKRNHALVSPTAGTTRDYLSAQLDLNGLTIELIDTAGWDDIRGVVEQRAQHLRDLQTRRADLVIWCTAAQLGESDKQLNDSLRQEVGAQCRLVMDIRTFADLESCEAAPDDALQVSGLTGDQIPALLHEVRTKLTAEHANRDELLGSTGARCRESLAKCVRGLTAAADAVRQGAGDEIVSLEIRQSLTELSTVMGEVYTDDILDHIFSSFCIGK